MGLLARAAQSNRELQAYYRSTCTHYADLYPLEHGTSWVQGRFRGAVFVMGCTACERAKAVTPFGAFSICTRSAISNHVLQRHQESKGHKDAIAQHSSDGFGAPSVAAFSKVLDAPCKVDDHIGARGVCRRQN